MAVFTGIRIRDNNVFGTTTDNPLTNVATTLNSAGLANLSAVSSNHAVLVLDPLRTAGAPEIVVVTAHTAAATSATVTRGAYGTTARQHAAGVLWVHAPTIDDVIRICTSSTRPADQYEGQLIYETDTDSFKAYLAAWEHVLTLGAWTAWTPTLTNLTLGSGSSVAAYLKIGRNVRYRWRFLLGAGSAVGTDPSFTLPFAPAAAYTGQDCPVGEVMHMDQGTATYRGPVVLTSGSTVACRVFNSAGTYVVSNTVTATAPHTWASTDAIFAYGSYEAAA